ncbi:MAG: S8 family peptidase [Myxococcota bacterium]
MKNHRVLLCTLLATGLMGLACSGGADAPDGGKADPAKLRVGDRGLKPHKRDKRPTGAAMAKAHKKNEFVVKLAKGVDELHLANGKVKTGKAGLDGAFGQLSLEDSGAAYNQQFANPAVAERLGLGRTIRIRTNKSPEEVLKKLEANEEVEWVEQAVELQCAGVPNDPYWKYQWHLQNLHVDQAWEITQGEGVVVAVVDTGVSAHEDGFFKLLQGHDFVANDDDPADENGHGSHVAGTIGQASNNGIGVAGVAPKVSILPVRVLDANGSGSNTWVAEGIVWAVDHGANIINLSLGSPASSEAIADAVAYAYENGVTVVAATGNDGYTDFIGFPAALETTIAVGSVDLKNEVAFYSNQGKEIDLVAPGGDSTADKNGDGQQDGVLQETRLNGTWAYHFLQGTSMATPHVAGTAALLYSKGVTDPDKIRKVLTATATDLGDKGWDTVYGAGLVNPVAALKGGRGKQRDADRGKGRGGDDGGDQLVITRTRVKKTGETRAVIGWLTNEPARTLVKGDNGFERKDDTLTKTHQVAVQGKAGTTVKFVIGSATSKEDKVRDEVTVQF